MDSKADAACSPFASIGEIARKAPVVAFMRSDALLAAALSPGRFGGTEPFLMVAEKLAAAAQGAIDASFAAGAGIGDALLTGRTQPDLALRIVGAAIEPTRRCVSRNYDRLRRGERVRPASAGPAATDRAAE